MTKKEYLRRIAMVIQAHKAGFLSVMEAYEEIRKIESEANIERKEK